MFWQTVHEADQQLTLIINGWNSPLSDTIWAFFSNIPVWIPMYALIIALMFWRLGWKKALIAVAAFVLTFGFCDQFSNLIKDAVERLRPVNDAFMKLNGLHILETGGGFSFFSAHAANSFGLAMGCFQMLKEDKSTGIMIFKIWMFTWATLVAVSRIFVGKHYLGDVLVGTMVGLLAGWAIAGIGRLCIRKWITRH